mgnify:CR=1 FL=1
MLFPNDREALRRMYLEAWQRHRDGLPLEPQAQEIENKRRHGMGYLGLGSALTMLGIRYGSEESLAFTEKVTRELAVTGWECALELAKEKGAKRAIPLPVSAPFHCSLMQPAAEAMAAALSEVAFHAPAVPLVGNTWDGPAA